MKKIKDFIYDYNDVFVAMIIVAAAAAVIFWRINTVMDYSAYLTAHSSSSETTVDVDFSDVDLNPEEVPDIEDPGTDETENGGTETPTEGETTDPGTSETTEDPTQETTGSAVEPAPTEEVKSYTLIVGKNGVSSWSAVGDKLEAAGIIESKKTFISRVVARKLDSNLQTGTFDFTSDMTLDEVIDMLTK